ncbi:zinc-binding dehydrogenase [Rickettsiella massiliensis]|uniref:zinc-binding dehydrogenase n=1 Tax=Rickettsiella massiliensis TaxID=676517 RepID=UPI00029AD065|nr:zinc-binding dehydrogenase [Rickettsiella massiliensis]
MIIGAGPIGMAALLTAQFYSPARIIVVDTDVNRLKIAETFGANDIINPKTEEVIERLLVITDQVGVDVAIEAVGVTDSFYANKSLLWEVILLISVYTEKVLNYILKNSGPKISSFRWGSSIQTPYPCC